VEALQSWLAAGDLTVGMQVRIRDGTVRTITQVQLLSLTDRQATYNLHVEEVNNFFAGNLELLVHNIDPARLAYLMRPGYSNYVLIDINGKIYYSGMFGPNESVASVQRRHSLNHDRFQPANGDRLQVIAEDQMYGEARLTEQRVAEANNTIKSNSDPNSYRQNRQNPLDPKKRVEYEEFVEKCG
jgi:hypothetical protein